MSWRKEQGRAERGYHHGNLKEALLQAALGLIAEKGAAGFTFADAARMAGVSPAAPYRHFRDRDELLSSIAQRGFEQFEAMLTQAWDDGRPDTVTAFERVGKAYLAFAREEPAFYSAMFESGLPVDLNPALLAASERAFARDQGRCRAARRAGAAGHTAAAGTDDGAAYLVDVARRGLVVRARRRGSPQAADVGGGSAGSGSADLSARARLPDRPPACGREAPAEKKPAGPAVGPPSGPWGTPKINRAGAAGARLDKNPGWFSVCKCYLHSQRRDAVMEREMAYTADVNRWRGPDEEPYRPHMLRFTMAPRLDRRDRARFHHLVADRPCPSLFHTREQKNGLLESSRPLVEQDGADAVQDGADAQPHGAAWLRLRSALERQPRLRRIPHGDAAAPRGGAGRSSRNSSTACATPRTRKSSTSSWRSIAPVRRRRPPTASPRPDGF